MHQAWHSGWESLMCVTLYSFCQCSTHVLALAFNQTNIMPWDRRVLFSVAAQADSLIFSFIVLG